MMRKILMALVCCVMLSAAAAPDDSPKLPTDSAVPGLTLPAAISAAPDDSFVIIKAETKGTVKWLVLSTNVKIKYSVSPATPNSITVGIPPTDGVISVFAVGLVDGKQTDFARTDITIKGGVAPQPPPVDPPTPVTPAGTPPFHLSIVEDPAKRTPGTRSIVDDKAFRDKLATKQVKMRVFSNADVDSLKKYRFDEAVNKYGLPLMILQDKTGKGLAVELLPADQSALIKKLTPIVGAL